MATVSLSDRILDNHIAANDFVRRGKPRWLRMALPHSQRYAQTVHLIREHKLHTVCEEAACPNMGECWSNGVATVMILGDVCTRSCGFCNIATGRPPTLDLDEPRRVADAIRLMNLRYVVITSVNRDELDDGGAAVWAETIRLTREAAPNTKIEVLIPDFQGDWNALQLVIDAKPDVINHNMETVRRMYPVVRPQAKYDRSIELLRRVREQNLPAKTGFMVGIGESDDEIRTLIDDVVEGTRVNNPGAKPTLEIMSIGQYLQPSVRHLPVSRFVHPDDFAGYKQYGESRGVTHIESGPMVRSSYHADKQAASATGAVVDRVY